MHEFKKKFGTDVLFYGVSSGLISLFGLITLPTLTKTSSPGLCDVWVQIGIIVGLLLSFITFSRENIRGIIPDNAEIVKIELICNKALNYSSGLRSIFKLPTPISSITDRILNRIIPKAGWMMVILDEK